MKRLSTRLVASAMALTMLFGALAACSKTTPAPETSKTEPKQEETKKDEPKVGGKVVVGATSEPSGDFATPYWQNNATDKDVNQLMVGYPTFYLTPDGSEETGNISKKLGRYLLLIVKENSLSLRTRTPLNSFEVPSLNSSKPTILTPLERLVLAPNSFKIELLKNRMFAA